MYGQMDAKPATDSRQNAEPGIRETGRQSPRIAFPAASADVGAVPCRAVSATSPSESDHAIRHREAPGECIGPYELLDVVGEGGAGTVWRARRKEPFTQVVALKIIKPGMDSEAVIARFEQERRALAELDHPSIARAIDGGITPRGRPYLVMDFVNGMPIDAACNAISATLRTRVLLLAEACDAIEHAHRRGFLHRDLSPGNVLVSQDERGVLKPKVIDFGVAKALSASGAGNVTELGEFIGTPAYSSPEQARREPADTRSDVWGLGAVLHQLVLGIPPVIDASGSVTGRAASLAALRCGQTIDRRMALARLTSEDAVDRSTTEERLRSAVSGELGWILDRALAANPDERYQSPGALAADLRAWCIGSTLEAGPRTLAYRARTYARTHRPQAIAASLALVALIGATVVSTVFALREAEAQRQAERRSDESRRIAQLQSKVLAELEPGFVGAAIVQDILNRHRDALVRDESDRDRRRELLKSTFSEITRLNRSDVGRAVIEQWLLEPMERAVAEDLQDLPLVAASMDMELARRWRVLGRFDRARTLATRALDVRQSLLPSDDPETAEALHLCGLLAWDQGQLDDATMLLQQSWDRAAMHAGGQPNLWQIAVDLGSILASQGRIHDAQKLLEDAVAGRAAAFGSDAPETSGAMRELGAVLSQTGDHARAVPMLRAAWQHRVATIGADAPGTTRAQVMLAMALLRSGDASGALAAADDGLPRMLKSLGRLNPAVLHLRGFRAECLIALGRADEARTELNDLLPAHVDALGPNHPQTERIRGIMATLAPQIESDPGSAAPPELPVPQP
jgi:non-specific serine/threonine protein kinase/serine/threonine-protein kinase